MSVIKIVSFGFSKTYFIIFCNDLCKFSSWSISAWMMTGSWSFTLLFFWLSVTSSQGLLTRWLDPFCHLHAIWGADSTHEDIFLYAQDTTDKFCTFFFFLGMTRVRVKLFFYLQFIYQNIRSLYFLCRVGPDELPCYTWNMPQCFVDVHKRCSNFPSKKRNAISLIPIGVIYTRAMLCNNYPLKKSFWTVHVLNNFPLFR